MMEILLTKIMKIHTIPSGPLGTNTFLIENGTGEAVVIDAPPGGYDDVMPLVREKGLTLKALLLTHGHFDHVLDTVRYQAEGVPVYVHRDSEEMVRDPAAWMLWPMPGLELQSLEWGSGDCVLDGETELKIAGMTIKVMQAPGHCPGSLIFYFSELTAAFVGDVIFYRSVGRTDFPGGDPMTLMGSIRDCVMSLPGDTVLYPGHGSLTSVDEEKQSNPYLS
jgi:hydroxyacylglutathione hydrolase